MSRWNRNNFKHPGKLREYSRSIDHDTRLPRGDNNARNNGKSTLAHRTMEYLQSMLEINYARNSLPAHFRNLTTLSLIFEPPINGGYGLTRLTAWSILDSHFKCLPHNYSQVNCSTHLLFLTDPYLNMDFFMSDLLPLRLNIQLGTDWYCVCVLQVPSWYFNTNWSMPSVSRIADHTTRQTQKNVANVSTKNVHNAKVQRTGYLKWHICIFVYVFTCHSILGNLLTIQCQCGDGPKVYINQPRCYICDHEACSSCQAVKWIQPCFSCPCLHRGIIICSPTATVMVPPVRQMRHSQYFHHAFSLLTWFIPKMLYSII